MGFNFPFQVPIVIILGLVLFLIAFIKIDIALIIFVFSMLLSPEINIGGIPGRAVVIRFDDILLLMIFIGWLAKMSINKEIGLIRVNPINTPVLSYIVVCLLSTTIAVLQGIVNPVHSIFYILKYTEYFLVFFMVSNNIKDEKQVKKFVFYMLLVCFIVSIFALITSLKTGLRATAPFEGKEGEPNTFAGYLILMMGLALGIFIYAGSMELHLASGCFFLFLLAPFIYTFSRSGWLGFFGMYLAFIFFSKKHKKILTLGLILSIFISPFVLPGAAQKRYDATFVGRDNYYILGKKVTLDESAAARIKAWKWSLQKWVERPLLGYGVPGGGTLFDVQYARILREVGITGLFVFSWMILRLFRVTKDNFGNSEIGSFGQGLNLGFFCSLIGLLVMGIGSEIFIIIRIMEPFWFLAAIVAVLPELKNTSALAN
ncbi:MAG: O-antigen ligase family protein [bacterium]